MRRSISTFIVLYNPMQQAGILFLGPLLLLFQGIRSHISLYFKVDLAFIFAITQKSFIVAQGF